MAIVLQGVLHGKTIELDQPSGLPDGQKVNVQLQPVEAPPEWLSRFGVDPTVAVGKLLVKGTRLLAEDLASELEQGRTDQELLTMHPDLTSVDVAALHHYVQVPAPLRRAFGGWAKDAAELDQHLALLREHRKIKRREIEG